MMQQPDTYLVRKATLKDLINFHEAACALAGELIPMQNFETIFNNIIKDKHNILFVLHTSSNKFAGCAVLQKKHLLSEKHTIIEFQDMYIAPKFRKLGAAHFLYKFIEDQLVVNDMFKIVVNCGIHSTLNQHFYTHKGFVISKKQYQKQFVFKSQ